MSQSKPGAGSGFWMDLGRFLVEILVATAAVAFIGGISYLIMRVIL